jgi:hypothetical protein
MFRVLCAWAGMWRGFSGIQIRRADGQKGEAQEEFGCVTGDALSVK